MKSVKVLGLIVSGLVGLSLTAAQAQALKERTREKETFKTHEREGKVDSKLEQKRVEEKSKEAAERAVTSGVTTKDVGISEYSNNASAFGSFGLVKAQMDKTSCAMSSGLRVANDAMTVADKQLFDSTMTRVVELASANGYGTIVNVPLHDSFNNQVTLLNTGEVANFVYNNTLTDAVLRQGGLVIAEALKTGLENGGNTTIVGEWKVPSSVVDIFAERITDGDLEKARKEVGNFCNAGCDAFSTGVNFCKKAKAA